MQNNSRMRPWGDSWDISRDINDDNWADMSLYFRYVQYSDFFDEEVEEYDSRFASLQSETNNNKITLKNYGLQPLVVNITKASKQNNNFRTGLWKGEHLQVTLMSKNVGDDKA